MQITLYALILLFSLASYVVGSAQIINKKYKPNLFSRFVWLLLAINTFAAVMAANSTKSSFLLALVFLIGNASIFILSFWTGSRKIGKLEILCLALLSISGLFWIVADSPVLNLLIGLLAHLIGGIPTYARVWKDAKTESTPFWSLFFIASILSIVSGLGQSLEALIFPIYFAFFDGSMTILSVRKNHSHKPKTT